MLRCGHSIPGAWPLLPRYGSSVASDSRTEQRNNRGSESLNEGQNRHERKRQLVWQEWQGSNLRPPVLETGALPIELHSCMDQPSPPIRAVSSIGTAPIARAKRLTRA